MSTLKRQMGFTLVEVLLALSIIAIALTALLKSTSQSIENTQRIKDKSISHWVAMQAVTMIQLKLVQLNPSQESTQTTTLANQKWYWRAKISSTPIKNVQQLTITLSLSPTGPFREELIAYRLAS